MKRGYISMETRYAAALLTMLRVDESGKFVPVISHEEAKTLTAKQIISRFELQHYPIPHSQGGSDHPSNLMPMIKAEHREVTAKVDIPQIAKTKRVSKEHEAFRARMLIPKDERLPRQSRWGSRPFPKRSKLK